MTTTSRPWCALLGTLLAAWLGLPTAATAAEGIASGHALLTISDAVAAAPSIRIVVDGADLYRTDAALSLQLLDAGHDTRWLQGGYAAVIRDGAAVHASGEVRSPAGSVFRFHDVYAAGPVAGSFMFRREVSVSPGAADDAGFLTRFSLHETVPVPLREHEGFIPGILYRDNHLASRGALAADLADEFMIVREDRMPLPVVMMRRTTDHASIALVHVQPAGTTCLADYSGARVVDQGIQVASLGMYSQADPAVACYYPAAEGQRSYLPQVGMAEDPGNRWAERFHPVRQGVGHAYQLLITVGRHADFPHAMREAWRTAYAQSKPAICTTDIRASYEASMALITDWSLDRNGCPGLPFRLKLPRGELEGDSFVNFQMGFIGQQLPLAYHLLRYGLLTKNEAIVAKGEAAVAFWAARSSGDGGLPRTWFDVYPQPHWRRYNTFLRVASDGMSGALRAWEVMRKNGRSRPEWLTFCRAFGDWLVKHQNADGSWCREYDWDGKVVDQGKLTTTHPITFLLDLAKATSARTYRDAALRAGEFCWSNVHLAFAYVGGTPDNPNVIDKEAGVIALDAFLALHEATREKRWLEAAIQAADFTETWQYSWSIRVPPEDAASTYPKTASSTAFSLIATGHSGADLYLAGAAFSYDQLYRRSGDPHYRDLARQLLYNTKTAMDIDGSLGYGHTGLCPEAISLASPRGRGVGTWLPWLSYNMIDPVTRLQDAYGSMDLPPPAER